MLFETCHRATVENLSLMVALRHIRFEATPFLIANRNVSLTHGRASGMQENLCITLYRLFSRPLTLTPPTSNSVPAAATTTTAEALQLEVIKFKEHFFTKRLYCR
jgi:hypothetical protein